MSTGKVIAATTLIGVIAITVGDAPDWRVEPYIGLLAAMTGISVISNVNADLANAIAGLVAVVLILQRGERLTNAVTSWVT